MSEVEVHQLRFATVELPEFHPEAPGRDTVHGFLVRDREACILVDTGVGTDSVLIDRLYKPDRVELHAALVEFDVSLRDVTAVVNTHLHFDHCGNNRLFPGVPIFVQQAELEAAGQPEYTVSEWVHFADAKYVPIHGRHAISERIELMPTPGHTPGHQSVVVRSGGVTEIIVGQAAYTAAEFQLFFEHRADEPDSPLGRYIQSNASWSRESYISSLAMLRQTRPDRARFSHDPTVWKRIPPSPPPSI